METSAAGLASGIAFAAPTSVVGAPAFSGGMGVTGFGAAPPASGAASVLSLIVRADSSFPLLTRPPTSFLTFPAPTGALEIVGLLEVLGGRRVDSLVHGGDEGFLVELARLLLVHLVDLRGGRFAGDLVRGTSRGLLRLVDFGGGRRMLLFLGGDLLDLARYRLKLGISLRFELGCGRGRRFARALNMRHDLVDVAVAIAVLEALEQTHPLRGRRARQARVKRKARVGSDLRSRHLAVVNICRGVRSRRLPRSAFFGGVGRFSHRLPRERGRR